MPISFELVPSNLRVPGAFVEFDNSQAVRGLAGIPFRLLIIGQKLSTGSKPANTLVLVNSADEAKTFFGNGSMLLHMVEMVKRNNRFTPVWVMPLDDAGAGVQATGNIIFAGSATKAGVIYLYVGGRRITVAVPSGTGSNGVALLVTAAITAELPVSAAVNGGDANRVDFTARHKGLLGNGIDLRLNYNQGEVLPTGITATVTAMANGATNPTLTTAIANLGEEWFQVVAFPYTDATSLTAIEGELADRFGPIRAIEGHAFACAADTVSNLTTLGNGRNSPHVSITGIKGSPTPSYEIAAAIAGIAGEHFQRDPARPLQTLELRGVLPPVEADRFDITEKNTLLSDGIATLSVDRAGAVRIERLVTTYQTTPSGTPDISYLDANTLFTLGFLRFTLRARFLAKFPRHKLASDGTRFGAGQAVLTPRIARAELLTLAREWEAAGLVENLDQYKQELVVERNASDPNRLDMLLPPDLINQLVVTAAQIEFRL